MSSPDLNEFLSDAVEAARRGAVELESWRNRFRVREKSRADLVTDADHASQAAIKDYLLGRYPDHVFLGEEDSVGKPIETLRPATGSPPVWVVDPLDGTGNYAHGVPAYCVNIGVLLDGKAVVGVTLDPRLNELYTAAAGRGAFLNGERIHVSPIPTLHDGLFATGFPANYEAQLRNLEAWKRVAYHAQALRRTGSSAINLAYVAAGRFDGYWCYDNWPWDVVAGAVLVTEAGGRLSASDGTPFDPFRMDILATNGLTHEELQRALAAQ
jgi:myo-inositol-1(or 4)-monophosphatase